MLAWSEVSILITRRRFLERAGILAAGMSVHKLPPPQPSSTTLDPDKLSPWVDPLPIPQIALPSGTRPSPDDPSLKLPYYRMAMRPVECKVHRDLPATRMWGFGNSAPGPTFETRSNHGLIVEWVNELPEAQSLEFLPCVTRDFLGGPIDVNELVALFNENGCGNRIGQSPEFCLALS